MCAMGLIYSQYLSLHHQTFINIGVMIFSLATFLKLDLLILEKKKNADQLNSYVKDISE